ncbi:MAG: hypothetical protein IT307_16070, partial [Chloroflexi bacterium]|nr:hypothetical protein [Chloroflexota bacterium]
MRAVSMMGRVRRIDISATPELRRVVEEVRQSRVPRVLECDGEELAAVIPLTASTAAGRRRQLLEAQIWADVGIKDPDAIWESYDPAAVAAAAEQALGAFD